MQRNGESGPFSHWRETHESSGEARTVYRPLLERLDALPRTQIRALDERLEATMREMGVTFDIARERPWGRRPWFCDLLPQIFTPQEWEPLEKGVQQRVRAFEMFLRDIYGKKEILRANRLPIQPILGSTVYQRAAASLTPPRAPICTSAGSASAGFPPANSR